MKKKTEIRFDGGYGQIYEVDASGRRIPYGCRRDEYGNPVEKTKEEYPYSYDAFVVYGRRDEEKCNGSVYTDRLYQWDHEKTKSLNIKDWTSNFKGIEAFLREWQGHEKLELLQVVEYCNVSNGYPTWRLDYYYEEKKDGEKCKGNSNP